MLPTCWKCGTGVLPRPRPWMDSQPEGQHRCPRGPAQEPRPQLHTGPVCFLCTQRAQSTQVPAEPEADPGGSWGSDTAPRTV